MLKIGIIGCGNMGGAILYGALESGVLPKENAYVCDINPAMMEKAEYVKITGVVSRIDQTSRILQIVQTKILFDDIVEVHLA